MTYRIHTRAELLAEGLAATTIDDRCRRGVYTRLLPRTYCLGAPIGLARGAAVVAWIPSARLSHRTAAWLHGMLPEPVVFEATVPPPIHRSAPKWLKLYRRALPANAMDEILGLPTTTPARTLLDCTAVMSETEAGAIIDSHLRRTVAEDEVRALCDSGQLGAPALRRQLREAALYSASEPERLLARALARRHLLLRPNHPVGRYICDFVDERSRTIVEIDGREFHSAPETFRNDRRRQNRLVLDGWMVLRYAAADVFTAVDACADEVVAVVRRRRRSRPA
ncbi:DUF559 domain-containing protein [Nocardia sp. NPDC005366]|uniref:DUF559 domain-containing protein n=1 Tax=Nocardia sp. NPDC005366 TaxID=3156878 RepID=UPI0033BE37AC